MKVYGDYGLPIKNVILVVTVTGRGPHPRYDHPIIQSSGQAAAKLAAKHNSEDSMLVNKWGD